MEDDVNSLDVADSDDPEERERFWKELVKAREVEKRRMIAEKKWADPDAPMRLEDAITPVGTCTDMCPKFERYRREREHNLDKWEVIPGTKRVDHSRAVKMYERASGAKSLPSDLRTPETCQRTLDYLFHDLLPRGGFTETHSFIRDRSRAVRNDFTPQLITGPLAIECHDRCARFHIIAMHLLRDVTGFDLRLEEQQLSHALLSLQQFYEDQRGQFSSPTELEMRVYQRLISIRNLQESHDKVPGHITSHPVFQLTTRFRQHVQKESAPINRTSSLRVGQAGMQIFGELAAVLRQQNDTVMIYLIACILERLFGKDTIEDIEAIRGSLSVSDIIDGVSQPADTFVSSPVAALDEEIVDEFVDELVEEEPSSEPPPVQRGATEWLNSNFSTQNNSSQPSSTFTSFSPLATTPPFPASTSAPVSAFANIKSVPNAFGSGTFGNAGSVFGGPSRPASVFGGPPSAFASITPSPSNPPSTPAISPPPAPSPPRGNSIFSADLKDKPFGSLPAAAFKSPPASQAPTPPLPPPASNGFMQAMQPGPAPSIPTSQFSLNPQASTFTPSSLSSTTLTAPTPTQPRITPQVQLPPSSPFPSLSRTTPVTPRTSSSPPVLTVDTSSKPPTPEPRIIERRQTLWEMPSLNMSKSTPEADYVATAPSTPTEPPPIGKPTHMPLPPTPTARWFDPSSQQPKPGSSSSSLLRKQSLIGFPLQMPGSAENTGILSPLHIPSPGSLQWPAAPGAPASPTPAGPSSPLLITSPITSKSKGKARQIDVDLDHLAADFVVKHSATAKCFKKWLKKTTDYAAWHEACRRSDAYREKSEKEKHTRSMNSSRSKGRDQSASKRRASLGTDLDSHASKRIRRRKSMDYKAAITDDELVQQLRENQEEHQRRWAQGSFLATIRNRVSALSPDPESHSAWRAWLSLNTENDGTAIWLEHKFNVPHSGQWLTEAVFSMPAKPREIFTHMLLGSPGLVMLERTPLEGITDAIERKYRVLDDCSRLRDIAEGLASDSKQRFLPELLVITWSDGGEEETSKDFTDMAHSFVQAGHFKGYHTFSVSSTDQDLDQRFKDIVDSMALEVNDRLTQKLSWQDLLTMFMEPYKSSASDWLHTCWIDDTFEWTRYNEVLKAIREAQFQAVQAILTVLGKKSEIRIDMPVDMQAPAHLGRDYATGPFLDVFVTVAIATAERLVGGERPTSYSVPRERVTYAFEALSNALESISNRLRESGATSLMRWSKRRADDDISPSSTPKRLRPSLSRDTSESDFSITEDSPPPSSLATSTAGYTETTEKPPVTTAMLRALARDILKSR
ncbi:hypothetical protein EIP91_009186 [Steccherinum ochraceum]|uniref:SAC3/GANP/THP3 conserved domain-containing protein n=1 Tax=Steccherinum ochraceum TaxID=92696 RepID=A0A4R0RF00_9APHY|nr:hypothetical protein EIP91_009186 [Steccherinum ochraceum]